MTYLPFGAGGFAGGLLPRGPPDLCPGTVLGPLGGRGLLMVIPLKPLQIAACLRGAGHADRVLNGCDGVNLTRKNDELQTYCINAASMQNKCNLLLIALWFVLRRSAPPTPAQP